MEDCSPNEVYAFHTFLKYLKGVADYGITPANEKFLLKELEKSISFMSHLILGYKFPQIQRLTINKRIFNTNKRIYDISYLKYPPKELVTKYGRCNLKNQSILYGAFDILTVLNELKPQRGDLITVSKWESIDDASLIITPILRQPSGDAFNPRLHEISKYYNDALKDYPPNIKKQIILLNEFIADAFIKRITTKNDADYLFSAYFSDRILNKFENGEIEAIYYPSVQSNLHFENLAIKPKSFDEKYKLIGVKESVVDMDITDGTRGVMMLGIGEATIFDYEKGKILWDDVIRQPLERMEYIKDMYGYEL